MDFEKEIFGRNKQARHNALLHIVGSTGTHGLVELIECMLDRTEKKLNALRKRLSTLENAAAKPEKKPEEKKEEKKAK